MSRSRPSPGDLKWRLTPSNIVRVTVQKLIDKDYCYVSKFGSRKMVVVNMEDLFNTKLAAKEERMIRRMHSEREK